MRLLIGPATRALTAYTADAILKKVEYTRALSAYREGQAVSQAELRRIQQDLTTVQRAMGLHLPFGKGVLAFGTLLTVAAVGAAVVSLMAEGAWLQIAPLAAIMLLVPTGLYLRSRRTTNLDPEITLQVVLSVGIYGIVWGAACGYALAAFLGPTVGAARTALFYAISIGLLLAFSVILVRMALRSRGRYYCLGLAVSTLLAGMLLPVLDQHYCYPLAHCFMAAGYLTGVAIQWVQLREAVANHAAD